MTFKTVKINFFFNPSRCMKKVILLALLMPYTVFGQIAENFESGSADNWVQSAEGRWKADSSASISGKFSLHHCYDNPDSGTDRIGIQVKNLHPSEGLTRWSFLIRHGYDPSSSNNWSVFLLSDAEPDAMSADGNTNGFAVGVNLIGYDDTLRLWKVKGNVVTTVINCRINWQTTVGITGAVKISVERSQEGNWTVSVYRLNGNLIGTGSGTDKELFSPRWFGVYYRYSSTRDRLLWLDDILIEGNFYEDNKAPEVTAYDVSGKKSIDITFSEEPSDESVIPANFSLNAGENRTVSVVLKKTLTYRVEFANDFINKQIYSLIINNMCDISGNCTQKIEFTFTPVRAVTGDVIISEIMADPLPAVSLPGKEYIEITNRTEFSFNLGKWKLFSEVKGVLFPETVIKPFEIRIICLEQDTSLFTKFGRVTGLKQFSSLADGGGILCLSDSSGSLIHGVEYSSAWYGDELKSRGGWSLEMVDTRFPFYYEGNWAASFSRKGGTPGSANSVSHNNPDISFYGIQNVFPDDSLNLIVRFSEPVFDLPGKIQNIWIGGKVIADLYPTDPLFREFSIKIGDPLLRGEVYQLDFSGDIKDFAGNRMQKENFNFGLPEPPGPGDILFNELLFNPLPGDPDYIELFNCSQKIIDASRLQLVSVNGDTGDTSQTSLVSNERRCIMAGSYYALTTDMGRVSDRYISADPEFIFENVSLPSMADSEGHLVLYNMELDRIDEVYYNEKMHYSLLSGYEGIALEKTGPNNTSSEAVNWHSATESSGWGTPGTRNSVFIELPPASDKVIFSSSKITPDNDGYEDILVIRLSLTGNGNVVSVSVFDEAGNYVKKIASNMFAGPEASIIWDGTADDGSPVNTGIYIVFITLYDDTGKTERWKKACTVIRN
jgi:hypothetical protein